MIANKDIKVIIVPPELEKRAKLLTEGEVPIAVNPNLEKDEWLLIEK